MLGSCRSELICDLAETYNIYDYHGVPVRLLGTLASGLGQNSRVAMKLSGNKAPLDTIILARMHDLLAAYVYSWSDKKSGQAPEPLVEMFIERPEPPKKYQGYASGEDFKAAWRKLVGEMK